MAGALLGFGRTIMVLSGLSLAAAIAVIWQLDSWGITPERAARRDGYCQDAPAIKVHRQSRSRAIAVCRDLAGPLDGGHVIVSRMPWGTWWASPAGANVTYQPSSPSKRVDYIYNGPTQSVHTSLMMFGRVHSPEVVALEATLSNGQRLRDEATNGLFVLDAPIQSVGVGVNELKVLGRDHQVLERIAVNEVMGNGE